MVPGLYDIVYSLAISTNFLFLPFFKFNFSTIPFDPDIKEYVRFRLDLWCFNNISEYVRNELPIPFCVDVME